MVSALGQQPWALLVLLIDEKSVADADIQAKTMSLINRVSKMHTTCWVVLMINIPPCADTSKF